MTTMFIDKLRIKDLEETLANSTTFLAFVGAGDLAVEKIRAASIELVNLTATFDSKAFRDQAQATFVLGVEALQTEAMTAPEQIKALPEKAQDWPAKAQSLFADVLSTAFSTYGELAGRGMAVVSQVRTEQPTVDDVVPVSRPATSTAKKTAVKRPVAKKKVKKPTNAASLAGTTLATKTATAKTPAAKTLASKKSAATPAAKSLAGKTLGAKKSSVKTPAAKKLAATSATKSAKTATPEDALG